LRKSSVLGLVFVAVLVLSGCVRTLDLSVSDPEENSAPQDLSQIKIESIQDLKYYFGLAGGSCPDWVQDDRVEGSIASGNCDDETVLSVYSSEQAASEAAQRLISLIASIGMEGAVLQGDKWVINSGQIDVLTSTLGGTIISTNDLSKETGRGAENLSDLKATECQELSIKVESFLLSEVLRQAQENDFSGAVLAQKARAEGIHFRLIAESLEDPFLRAVLSDHVEILENAESESADWDDPFDAMNVLELIRGTWTTVETYCGW